MFGKKVFCILSVFLGLSLPVSAQENTGDDFGKVIVYYFHPDYRNFICNKVERMTREAVEQNFVAEAEEGKVEFRSVDITKKENKALAQNYEIGIGNRVVVLARVFDYKDEEVRKPEQVWRLSIDEIKYKKYISDEIANMLKQEKPKSRWKTMLRAK